MNLGVTIASVAAILAPASACVGEPFDGQSVVDHTLPIAFTVYSSTAGTSVSVHCRPDFISASYQFVDDINVSRDVYRHISGGDIFRGQLDITIPDHLWADWHGYHTECKLTAPHPTAPGELLDYATFTMDGAACFLSELGAGAHVWMARHDCKSGSSVHIGEWVW